MRSGPNIWMLSMNPVEAATMLMAPTSISVKAVLFLNSLVQSVWKKPKLCPPHPLRYSCKHLQSLLSRPLKSTYYLIIWTPYFCPISSNSFPTAEIRVCVVRHLALYHSCLFIFKRSAQIVSNPLMIIFLWTQYQCIICLSPNTVSPNTVTI